MNKTIQSVMPGMPTSDGAGVNLTRAVGQPNLKNIDPFLMLDEIRSDNPNDYIAGFPPHPHKGFETLTYMLQGSMEHNDSTGGHGLINTGGVQYMTAGKGIIHSETPKQDSGLMWGFQLWMNLPAKDKLQDASYVDISAQQIPVVHLNETTELKLIAGQVKPHVEVGPVKRSDIDLQIYDVKTAKSGSASFDFSSTSRGFLYVYQGEVSVNDRVVKAQHVAALTAGETLQIASTDNSGFLLCVAEPIGEPIVQYGPFVMNTSAEIEQAIRDYQAGVFV